MPKNKGYGIFRFVDENGKEQFRKPSIRQRKRILTYYIRRCSGRILKVHNIAKAFKVSDRTIQKLLKELEVEGIIRREPVYDESGFQKANKIIYIGDKKRLTGTEPSIEKIYDKDNPLNLEILNGKIFGNIRMTTTAFLLKSAKTLMMTSLGL